MVSGLQLASVLLVWLLSESDSSTSFPAQGSVYPEDWQNLRERYHTRSRRPLQYIQALREADRNPPHHGSPLPSAQFPNDRDLSNQNQRPDPTGRPRAAPRRNHQAAESNLEVPLLDFQSQAKETRPTAHGGRSKAPANFELNLKRPSESSRPGFRFASSGPTSHKTQSRNIGNKQPPTHSLPISPYPQQYDDVNIGFVDGLRSKDSSKRTFVRPPLIDFVNGRSDIQINPTSHVDEEDQSGQTVSPHPVSLSQYGRFPSGHYNAGQAKPSGNRYGTHQTSLSAGTPMYDGYARPNMAETLVGNPSPLPRSRNPETRSTIGSTWPRLTPNSPGYVRPPIMDSELNPYASNPQNQMLPEQLQASDGVPSRDPSTEHYSLNPPVLQLP